MLITYTCDTCGFSSEDKNEVLHCEETHGRCVSSDNKNLATKIVKKLNDHCNSIRCSQCLYDKYDTTSTNCYIDFVVENYNVTSKGD